MRRTGRKSLQGKPESKKRGRNAPVVLKIRKGRGSDLEEIVRMSAGVREIENYPGQKMTAADFRHFLNGRDAMMLVAVVQDGNTRKEEVVGYVTVYRSENYFYLPYAVTKRGWRRPGVAGKLLGEIEKLAKDGRVEYILMSVYAYNRAVSTFLKARDYVPSKSLIQYSKLIKTKGRK